MSTETPGTLSTLDIRVYYEDTDAAGVVFYANYLKFFERGRTEWLRRLGVNQSDLAANEQRMFVVKSAHTQYIKPARFDDLLTIHSRITRLGRASIHFAQTATTRGETLCEGTVEVVCVDTRSFRPAGLPPTLRTLLQKAQN